MGLKRNVAPAIDVIGPLGFNVWNYRGAGLDMLRPHSHADLELNFLTGGWLKYAFAGRFVTIEPGRFVLFWASVPHQAIDSSGVVEGIWATFPLPLLLGWNLPHRFAERLVNGDCIQSQFDEESARLDQFMLKRWVVDRGSGDPERRRTLLLEIEARLRRLAAEYKQTRESPPSRKPEPGIESALAFLHAHYRDDICAADAGRAAGWNTKYLMRAFKRTLNMSLGVYLARLRITHAQWLLLSSDRGMLDIAYESGFQSVAPFYQAFRKITNGVTPLKFRKQMRGAAKGGE